MRRQVQAAPPVTADTSVGVSPAVRLGEPRAGRAASGPLQDLFGAACRGGCLHLGAPFPNGPVPLACAAPT